MQPSPKDAINGQLDGSQMYLNRILMKVKDADDETKSAGRAFVSSAKAILGDLAAYAGDFTYTCSRAFTR
jgi:hypothetical protein